MLALFEKLKKEWQMIRAAPMSFVTVCLVAVVALSAGFRWFYSEKFSEANRQITQWKTDADYWKDQASHSKSDSSAEAKCPPTQASPPFASPKPTTPPKATRPHYQGAMQAPSEPPAQAATGNNNGQVGGGVQAGPCSNVQIGGSNNQANTNCLPPERHLTEAQKGALTKVAAALPDNSNFLHIEMVNDPESLRYGTEISGIFASKTNNIGTALSWGKDAPPEGISVVIDSQQEPLFPTAQKIADAFGGAANFTRFRKPKPGTIYIVVGTAPRHQ